MTGQTNSYCSHSTVTIIEINQQDVTASPVNGDIDIDSSEIVKDVLCQTIAVVSVYDVRTCVHCDLAFFAAAL